jgi:cyclic beta-1,2-glucan synthetase
VASLDLQTPPSPTVPLEELAQRLAGAHASTGREDGRGVRRRLVALEASLRALYRGLGDPRTAAAANPQAAEWLLDNQHVVRAALRQVAEGLPPGFYRELPKLVSGPSAGEARIYTVARVVLDEAGGHVDIERAGRFLDAYQRVAPLSMGEVWAFPTMLRLVAIEDLARAGSRLAAAATEVGSAAGPAGAAGDGGGTADPLDPGRISIAILGLRALAACDWKTFFEAVSRIEGVLQGDPAGVYGAMDFATRDGYRKAVERTAREAGRRTGAYEETVARAAVELGREAGPDATRRRHVGYYLVDEGREELETRLGVAVARATRLRRRLARVAVPLYLGGIGVTTSALLAGAIAFTASRGGTASQTAVLMLVAAVPAMTVAVGLLNWIVTHAVKPRLLPKLDFEQGVPELFRTMVVVPCVLTSPDDVRSQLRELEINHLGNAGPNLSFALLADLADAPQRQLPEDEALLELARAGIQKLNDAHGGNGGTPFHLFHRERLWNHGEGRWMGWERKRGKLEEFNRLLRGAPDTSFGDEAGRLPDLRSVRFVLTIDADTFLPPASAARLVSTLAHPLNQAELDARGNVLAGYTVVQPRVETIPASATDTLFARVFEADAGLDLYSHVVSDVYQDLSGEGLYAGKAIYDPDAFERNLSGRAPENALLSHDLFEGVHGRAGLASDVTVFEHFPSHVLTYMRRLHRWVRGDWQLLPWLRARVPAAGGRETPNELSPLDRWKILDNLRRSLLAPSLLVLLWAGWLWLAGPAWVWTLVVIAVLGTPIFLQGASTVNRVVQGSRARPSLGTAWTRDVPGPAALRIGALQGLRSLGADVWRWFLALVFLPYEAVVVTDAVARTLLRLAVTRRRLLEWTTAAHSARALGSRTSAAVVWQQMAAAPALALASAALVFWLAPAALPVAAPLVLLWLASPQIAHRISLPKAARRAAPPAGDRERMRLLARRTWLYFQHFTGPDSRWLPPDNYQEDPGGIVAKRTSPTNIGLSLLGTLAAYDLGYVGALTLAATLRNTFESLERLERYRGHFLNWYDTRTLTPLAPRYVSTVDSGNLAACLLALGRGCAAMGRAPVLRAAQARGFLDTLSLLHETVTGIDAPELGDAAASISSKVDEIRERVLEAAGKPRILAGSLADLVEVHLPELEERVVALAETTPQELEPAVLGDLRVWTSAVRRDLFLVKRELDSLAPWLSLAVRPPALYSRPDFRSADAWRALLVTLPQRPTLVQVPKVCRRARKRLARLESRLVADGAPGDLLKEARAWNARLSAALDEAQRNARSALTDFRELAARFEEIVAGMEFGFLYDRRRCLFHLGFNVSAGEEDPNYYDLLASESRVASFLAIAKGDVATNHWLHLGRPFTRVNGTRALLSWGGTMFEYLMPGLLMRTPAHGLLGRSCRAAVERQIAYAEGHDAPWGVSESGYHQLDARGNYQYRAFGVPGLGLKRDLGEHLVVAPYASLLALPFEPGAVGENISRLRRRGMVGRYGLYEALDFGRPDSGEPARAVRSYMAHHQGMILLALDNHLNDGPMVRRFHSHPRVATVEYLLHEQVPWHVPVQAPLAADGRPSSRGPAKRAAAASWRPGLRGPLPQAHVLSNGRYSVLVTAAGAGGSRWRGIDLTRWRADPTLEDWGSWIYVQDVDSGALWSAGYEPTLKRPRREAVFFSPHMAEFRRRDHGIALRMAVTVPASDDLEIRRVRVVNEGEEVRRLALTSYAEVVLAPAAEDRRHPAFNKLFIESAFLPEADALLFRRRPRSAAEPPVYLLHALMVERGEGGALSWATRLADVLADDSSGSKDPPRPGILWETDRSLFVGRGGTQRRPAALSRGSGGLSRATGATLDPILALRCRLELAPHADAEVVFLTLAGSSRAELLARLDAYRSAARIDWAFEEAFERSERELDELGIAPGQPRHLQELLSALLFPFHELRAAPGMLGANTRSRRGLWSHGISGDRPILLVRVAHPEDVVFARQLFQAHAYWRRRGIEVDLAVLDEEATGYTQPVRDRLEQALAQAEGAGWLDQPGGIFILRADGLDDADRALIESAAAVVLGAGDGPLPQQLERLRARPSELPAFFPTPSAPLADEPTPALARPSDLIFDNGLGGFTPDGREYVVHLENGRSTPAPWVNVVANPDFGFLVSESGGGYTWAAHSAENRLTPWRNDPVEDRPGEALYLRDEETAEVWSPTPLPAGQGGAYRIRHGAGYSVFEHNRHGLEQRLSLFAVREAPVKVVQLRLTNRWRRHRRITATYYAEWVLGESRELSAPHLLPDYDHATGALLARNPFNETFGDRVAFLASGEPPHGLTADRREFLGQDGDLRRPAALYRIGLSGTVQSGRDPCAALQIHVDLAPGETRDVHFLLGQGRDRREALELAARFREADAVEAAWREVAEFWDGVLGAVSVRTPDRALDLVLNRWLLYQTLSCRIWGRSALYQSSGAYGFRDQLQDVMALLDAAPDLARSHILESARHQFEEGDVLHWWHPPSGEGVRTRCSDDLLWLPFVTATYVARTGDESILDEELPFLAGEPLASDEGDRYTLFAQSAESGTLYEHCLRALKRGSTAGPHGLPLIGSGDWNDGLNRVGIEGRGESVWLGWFLHAALVGFAPLCERRGDREKAELLRQQAEMLRRAVESRAWDGDWYRRAYYDEGAPLGSASNREARIDSISQSWAVLSGAADPARAARAMRAVLEHLVRAGDGVNPDLVCLFWPPFDRTQRDPGYIKGYPPGIRENGGQYSHAAAWVGWALAELGEGDRAHAVFRMLNPVERSDSPAGAALYRVEPYATAADIYSSPPHTGRGGWTWYTGSAGWTYRLGVEAILGLRREGAKLRIDPCVPKKWPGYEVTYRYGASVYRIRVENPAGVSRGVESLTLDGAEVGETAAATRGDAERTRGDAARVPAIPLTDDGGVHEVLVRLGEKGISKPPPSNRS